MKILKSYLLKQLVLAFIMLLLVLTGLAWMLQILTMLKFLMNYGIGITGFIGLTTFMIPFIISIIMPFVVFISAMFVYNKMIADNEMTIMVATGIPPRKIARPIIKLAIALTLIHWTLNLWIVPTTQAKFYDTQWEMRYGLAHLKLQESAFTQLSNGLVIYVNQVSGHDLSQLMVYDKRDKKNQMTILAEKGKLVNTSRGLSVVMENGSLQMQGKNMTMGTFDSFDMDMNLGDKNGGYSFKVRRIPTDELVKLAMHPNKLKKSQIKLVITEIASRTLGPVMNLILALICVCIMLKMPLLRRRASMAPIFAVVGMASAMSLFMTATSLVRSIFDIALLGIIQLVIIIILIRLLPKK